MNLALSQNPVYILPKMTSMDMIHTLLLALLLTLFLPPGQPNQPPLRFIQLILKPLPEILLIFGHAALIRDDRSVNGCVVGWVDADHVRWYFVWVCG